MPRLEGRDLSGSYDEARMVLDQGIQLDRYLRLRTGQASVDSDLSEIQIESERNRQCVRSEDALLSRMWHAQLCA